MGRGKLKMELIEKEQSRWTTFQKRKRCLVRKAYEFSTLCQVDTCLVIYGPKLKSQTQRTVDIWPENPGKVREIIERYKAFDSHGAKAFHLFDYFLRRKKQIDESISKIRRSNIKAKYAMLKDDWIDQLSIDQIRRFLARLDEHLEALKRRIITLKENRCVSELLPVHASLLNQKKTEANQISNTAKPIDIQMPRYFLRDQTMPVDLRPLDNPVMTWMMMNHGDRFAPTNSYAVPLSYEPMTGLLENTEFDHNDDNRNALISACFCGQPMPQMLPRGQCSMVSSFPSEWYSGFRFNGFYGEMERHNKNAANRF